MLRKILLLMGSFIVLFSALMVYRFYNPPKGGDSVIKNVYVRPTNSTGGDTDISSVEKPSLEDRDKLGNLRGIYRCDSWSKNEVGDYILIKPYAKIIGKNGKLTYMTANKGVLTVEQLSKGMKVRQGFLTGDVKIYYDQSVVLGNRPEPFSMTKDQRLKAGILEVSLNNVRYNRDALKIITPDNFSVESDQLEIRGKGLEIEWNEKPRQLRRMEITQGEILRLKNLPRKANMFAMSTEPKSVEKQTPAEELENKTPESKIDKDVVVEGREVKAPQTFVANFKSNVKVVSGDQELSGADTLKLFFKWAKNMKMFASDEKKKSADSPKKDNSKTIATGDDSTFSEPAADDKTNELCITWKGPLVISPEKKQGVESTDDTPIAVAKNSKNQKQWFKIVGQGDDIKLQGKQGILNCMHFEYDNFLQRASFSGAKDSPAVLTMKKGEIIRSEGSVVFDRKKGFGLAEGKGNFFRPDKNDPTLMREEVTWSKSSKIFLGEQQTKNAANKKRNRFYIKRAHCLGDVKIVRRRTDKNNPFKQLPNDVIYADELNVTMFDPIDGKSAAKQAVATGNVRARQQGMKLKCDKATVNFGKPIAEIKPIEIAFESDDSKTKKAKDKLGLEKANLQTVVASGNVQVEYKDPQKPDQPATYIKADQIDVNWPVQEITLTGEPAKVWRNKDYVVGNQIQILGKKQDIIIDCPGELSYMTNQDMSGNSLKEPKKFTVNWAKKMKFEGLAGKGRFEGNVDLSLGTEKIETDLLTFKLADPEKPLKDKKELEDKAKKTSSPLKNKALAFDFFRGRKLKTVVAEGGKKGTDNVRVISKMMNPENKNWLGRRAQIECKKIDVNLDKKIINMPSAGRVVFEDYRIPDKDALKNQEANSRKQAGFMTQAGKLEAPSQALIVWSGSANIDQEKGKITISDDVIAILRSGNKIVKARNLPIAPMTSVTSGRSTTMKCGKLEIWSTTSDSKNENADKKQTKNDLIMGVNNFFESIKIVQLTKDVLVEDSSVNVTLDAQRLVYSKLSDVVKVWGYLPGAKVRTDASITYFDKLTGRLGTLKSPVLQYNNKTQSAKVEKVQAGGGM